MSGINRKIASKLIQNRKSTPLFGWLRDKMLAVHRDLKKTSPPGLPDENGKCSFQNHARFPNTQSSRDPDLPRLPGGVHHKLASNYYYDRDARREVEMPKLVFNSKISSDLNNLNENNNDLSGKMELVNKNSNENFGLTSNAPTPGFGYAWKRQILNEESSQKENPDLRLIEKFDSFKN